VARVYSSAAAQIAHTVPVASAKVWSFLKLARQFASSRPRYSISASTIHGQGDAKIGHQRNVLLQQDVLRLDVAVDHRS
jgi:hypothetical protein